MLSPLRYPGGKSDFLAIALDIFRSAGLDGYPVIEPYAGSAAISLGLLDFGLTPRVTLVERDPMLYAFWYCLFDNPEELIVRFQELPVSIETWRKFQPLLAVDAPSGANIQDLALAALFLNRTSFSGILGAGPIGGQKQRSPYKIDCRTNKDDLIARILAIASFSSRVDVLFGDALSTVVQLAGKRNAFVYLDPPYFSKGELLYRHHYRLGEHKALASALTQAKFKWLLSYDVHHVIRFLYSEYYILEQSFRYSAHSPKKNFPELLISNFPIAPRDWGQTIPRRQRHWPSEKNVETSCLSNQR